MRIKTFDTHCHPQFPQYDTDRESVLRRATEGGIGMICVGTDLRTSRDAVALASRTGGMWASVGMHPTDAEKASYVAEDYKALLNEKVVAIGEIGLDYYRSTDHEQQRELLRAQLDLADALTLPCIIHCRDAHADMINMLRGRSTRGVIHSFNGSITQALSYIEEGWHIGLNGIISFSDEYEDMVRSLPLDRILLETDAPYLSPVPYRGQRNEPLRVLDVASHIAQIRDMPLPDLLATTRQNTLGCFCRISIEQ